MKVWKVIVASLVFLLVPVLWKLPGFLFGDSAQTQQQQGTQYVCPMHPDVVSDKPGACRICGMDLVDKKMVEKTNVAILIFNGVQIIDYTAPYEIFGQKHLNVYTVAKDLRPIQTSMNMSVNPQYSLENAPKPFILVVPGGDVESAKNDPAVIQWIRNTSAGSDYVMSVCNGAFLLNKAGLLNGLSATTFHGLIEELKQEAPQTKVVRDKRYVDNGKIITTAGLSSGIDGSLYLISKIYGMDSAKSVALHLEYNWQPDSNFARAAMPDQYIPDLNLHDNPHVSEWQLTKNLGGMDNWDLEGEFHSDLTSAELLQFLGQEVKKTGKWKAQTLPAQWTFNDDGGHKWNATLSVKPVAGKDETFLLGLQLKRSS